MKVYDKAEETGDEQIEVRYWRSRQTSELPDADDESEEGQADDASLEKSTMGMREDDRARMDGKDCDGDITEALEEANVQEVERLYEQHVEEQAEGYPVEAEGGLLVEMQWQPDPFAAEDEDKENWDPQLVLHSFALRIEELEQRLPSET